MPYYLSAKVPLFAGGLAEMSLVAITLYIKAQFAALHHLARALFVIAGATATFELTH